MQITTKQFKHCDLVSVEGRIDSASAPQLAEALNAIMDDSRFKLVLDFEKVDFISSAGLRVLINAQKNCRRYNRGEICLASVPEKVYAAFDLSGFTTLFSIYDDVLTAVGSF